MRIPNQPVERQHRDGRPLVELHRLSTNIGDPGFGRGHYPARAEPIKGEKYDTHCHKAGGEVIKPPSCKFCSWQGVADLAFTFQPLGRELVDPEKTATNGKPMTPIYATTDGSLSITGDWFNDRLSACS